MLVEKENVQQQSSSVGMSGFLNQVRMRWLEENKEKVKGRSNVIDYQCSAKEIGHQISRTTNNK